jgi:antirestriction protein ArdC
MRDGNVYEIITQRIVASLEKGTIPWQKPWTTASAGDAMPRNLVSRKPYRGVNVFLLHAMSYASPYWLTFKQAQALGGNVRKGEKATPVVFWKWLDVEGNERDAQGKPKAERVPMLRYYSVFNVAQCDGISVPQPEGSDATKRTHSPIEAAEQIVETMPKRPAIAHGGNRACYSPALDRVDMPQAETFDTGEHYYSVLFHELTHATGHQSRLNRKGVAGSDGEWSAFGSTPYAREELVAEMGGAFLCGHAGIVERTLDNSASYIAGWLERLKNDHKLVVIAAAQAQKAADFILNVRHEASEGEESG